MEPENECCLDEDHRVMHFLDLAHVDLASDLITDVRFSIIIEVEIE